MHLLGKLLLFCVIVATGFAIVLSVKLLDVRNAWAKKIEEVTAQNEAKAKVLEEKRLKLAEMEAEVTRELVGMEVAKNGKGSMSLDGANSLTLEIGSNQGIRAGKSEEAGKPGEPPILHGFLVAPDGKSSAYFGSFQIATLREQQAAGPPTWQWQLRPGESDRANAGQDWRVRTVIPPAYQARFTDLDKELAAVAETLRSKQVALEAVRSNQLQPAQRSLAGRTAELVGSEEAPGGLIATVERDDEARNALLRDVDALRRQVKSAFDRMQTLKAENDRLALELPGAKALPSAALSSN